MEKKKIGELRRRIDALRRKGGVSSREVETLAKAVGRTLSPRGKEPTYVSPLPGRRPLSIPHHSTPLARFTKENILDMLEGDLNAYEERLISEIEGKNGHL